MWNFTISLHGDDTDEADLHSGARHSVRVGFPKEFGGSPEVWCPEGLLAASVGSSLMTSFRYYLRRNGGEAHSYMSAVEATLAKTKDGLRITSVNVATVIGTAGAANVAVARRAAQMAERTCPISLSLTCPVIVTWETNDVTQQNMNEETSDADLRVQV